jgi:hypothetical protein
VNAFVETAAQRRFLRALMPDTPDMWLTPHANGKMMLAILRCGTMQSQVLYRKLSRARLLKEARKLDRRTADIERKRWAAMEPPPTDLPMSWERRERGLMAIARMRSHRRFSAPVRSFMWA